VHDPSAYKEKKKGGEKNGYREAASLNLADAATHEREWVTGNVFRTDCLEKKNQQGIGKVGRVCVLLLIISERSCEILGVRSETFYERNLKAPCSLGGKMGGDK